MNEYVLLSVEEAGAGFAASVANANIYNGLGDKLNLQALMDIGVVSINEPKRKIIGIILSDDEKR